ncbi:toxic anion resistance protein [Zavarzinia sp. CC-PAN008]|uniref:toxic anion resistance protein n=1 Tax=Zavarzinia sp. CC-PAN008 TaxID=3243332 RepID=UPI003F7442D0
MSSTAAQLPVPSATPNIQAVATELARDVAAAPLTADERQKVEEIKKSVDLNDSAAVLQYGASVQNGIAEFADSILHTVKAKDSGEVGQKLTELMLKVKGLDTESIGKKPGFFGRLFGSAEREVRQFIAQYEDLGGQIDKITLQLDAAKDQLLRDIVMLDKLFERNLETFRQLNLYIIAGEDMVRDYTNRIIPEMEAAARAAEGSDGQLAAQRLNDVRQKLDRFEKKLQDLRLSKTVSLQTMPQIRLIQNGDTVLVEKIQSSILNTIPIWKNQMVIAISLFRQQGALTLQREVTNTTNEMLARNAELLKTGTIEITKEAERGIVDMSTLQKVNQDLISTIDEVLRIQADGRSKRRQAEQDLIRIETELKNKLIQG